MKLYHSRTMPLLVLLGLSAQLATGCVVRGVYTEPEVVVEPQVVVESYPPRWYEGRWIYYRGGGWGYYLADSWYAYPYSHPIYLVHHYPRRAVVHSYRPAAHHPPRYRATAVRSHAPHRSGSVVVRSDRRGNHPAPRATVRPAESHRRGDRVRAEQGRAGRSEQQSQSNVRRSRRQSSSPQEGNDNGTRRGSSRRGSGSGGRSGGDGGGGGHPPSGRSGQRI
ncbi:MAG: hypothetical protein FJ125_13075 [Deltaproteobacteria bacterium]|nr:hypothetical protein [Deltaproteobacteria bacterium]